MGSVRCARCESFYSRDDTGHNCRYHSGQYRGWWSCCKEPLFSARGCRSAAHVEDRAYTAMLDSYCPPAVEVQADTENFVVEGPDGRIMAVAGMIITQQDAPAPVESIEVPETAEASERPAASSTPSSMPAQQGGQDGRTVAVPYMVGSADTWSSICLRHRMSSEELLRLNGLRHRRCRLGDVLLVWSERSDAEQSEEIHRQLLRQFRRLTGASAAEALYYLENHDYAIGDAIREREHDAAWERERAAVVEVIHRDQADAREAEAAEAVERVAAAERMAARVAAAERMALRAAAGPAPESAFAKCLGAGSGCLAPLQHAPSPASTIAVPVI